MVATGQAVRGTSGRVDKNVAGVVLICVGLGVFSIQDVVIRSLSDGYSLHQIMFIRSVIAVPLTLVILGIDSRRPQLGTAHPGLHFLRGMAMFIAYGAFYMAMRILPLAETVAIAFCSPLIIAAFSGLFLGEKVGRFRLLAVLAGFAGVLIIVKPGASSLNVGALLALLCAFCYAIGQMIARKLGASDKGALMAFYASCFYLVGSAVMGVALGDGALMAGSSENFEFMFRAWQTPSVPDMALIIATSFTWAIGAYLVAEAYRQGEANAIAPFEYTALVWAAIMGFLFWDEIPAMSSAVGMILIAGSGLVVLFREHLQRQPSSFQSIRTGGAKVAPPPRR